MTTKLNLTIQESTAKRIKAYAAKRNTSVSKIVEEQLDFLLRSGNKKEEQSFVEKHQSVLKKYAGTTKGKFNDIDKLRDEYLKEKYGL
ncbi:MAG: DUF6364 family protein [Niabella sp.]